MNRSSFIFILACLSGCGARSTPAEKPADPVDVASTVDRYCLGCHNAISKQGGLILEDLEPDDRATWGRVADALRSRSMPPAGRPSPTPSERAAVDAWLGLEVFGCSATEAEPGRVTMRRLNRPEYNNAIRDLIGLDLRPADDFPADDVGYGFDKIGDVLSMPPILMEKYLAAADLAIEAAGRSPDAWAKLMAPPLDDVPPGLRKPIFPVRSDPIKRIGRPEPAAPVVEDPEAIALRRASEVLRAFADRAFRRPVTQSELARLVGLVESARKDGDDEAQAIRYALKAVLISPHFLFFVEEETPGRGRPIGEFELAARLASFLWSSLPDDELERLAARGELRRAGNLSAQVRRMLEDPKARALVDGFALQWLQVRGLRDHAPDPGSFPDFDEPLRRAMLEEASRFCASIMLEDRPIREFLDADHTFVNERLARHYGISGVSGDHFRRVSLAGGPRGGVLTLASVLTVTSNPTRTSPVKRGKWVLDNILGMPPPPPPSGVEALKAEGGIEHQATTRRRMEQHRADPGCASCHARMDPLGFSLEDFDAIGAWRTSEAGRPIDASGTLPGGEPFRGAPGLRAILIGRHDAFARALAEKLLTYALGRGLTDLDRCALDEIDRKRKLGDGRFFGLVIAIVESPPFQGRSKSRGNP